MMVVVGLLTAAPLRAQICAGFVNGNDQAAFGASAAFADRTKELGVEGGYNLRGPLAVSIGVTRQLHDEESGIARDVTDKTLFSATLAFDVNVSGTPRRPFLSICPVAAIRFASEFGFGYREVPLGLGVGSVLPLSPSGSPALMPYVVPSALFWRFKPRVDSADSGTDFMLRGGLLVDFGRSFVGAEARRIFRDGSRTLFGVRFGYRV
jgi:hypothetical protein